MSFWVYRDILSHFNFQLKGYQHTATGTYVRTYIVVVIPNNIYHDLKSVFILTLIFSFVLILTWFCFHFCFDLYFTLFHFSFFLFFDHDLNLILTFLSLNFYFLIFIFTFYFFIFTFYFRYTYTIESSSMRDLFIECCLGGFSTPSSTNPTETEIESKSVIKPLFTVRFFLLFIACYPFPKIFNFTFYF